MNSAPSTAFRPRSDLKAWQQTLLWLVAIAAVCFVAYRFSLSLGFVFDDHEQVVNNPMLRSWAGMKQAWSHQLWFQSRANGNYYRPLFITWGCLNYKLFGLQAWGWHAGAILLHVFACCGLFVLAVRLGLSRVAAGAAALIFALHPAHVECVSWISASSDAMATGFYLFALAAYIAARNGKARWGMWLLSLVLMAGAAFTKEVGITFPAIVFLYEWFYRREQSAVARLRSGVLGALPFVMVAATYVVARSAVLHNMSPAHGKQSLALVLMTLPSVLERYVEILVFPVGLNAFYYTPYVLGPGLLEFWIPLFVLGGVGALLVWAYRRTGDPLIAMGSLWMIVTLLPTLYLPVFPPGNFVRDRYIYLPSVGFVLVLIALLRRIPERAPERVLGLRVAVCGGLIALFGFGAMLQQVYWPNDLAVAYRGFQLNPRNVSAATYYAKSLSMAAKDQKAVEVLEYALKQRPEDVVPFYDVVFQTLAIAELRVGNLPAAKAAFENAVRYLGDADTATGKTFRANFLGAFGEYEPALQLYGEVLAQNPDSYEAVYNYGYTLYLMGRFHEAEQQFHHAVALTPDAADAHFYLGASLTREGEYHQAESELRRAIQLDPNGTHYHSTLAVNYELQGRTADAVREYRAELASHPDDKAAAGRLAALEPAK